MLQTVSGFLPELALLLMTAVATHLVMSFAQTLMHHHPIGGKFFRNHINYHHAYYSKDHLASIVDDGVPCPRCRIYAFRTTQGPEQDCHAWRTKVLTLRYAFTMLAR